MAEIRAYFAVREDNACDVRERRATGRTDEEKAEDRESSDVGEFDNGER